MSFALPFELKDLLGEQAPSSRLLLGADSQVALGTLIKGRATSKALNQELDPVHTLDAGTGCLLWNASTSTRSSTEVMIRREGEISGHPTRCWPEWIAEIEAGRFRGF